MTDEQYTALYAQVQVLTDRLARTGEDLATLRDSGAPRSEIARLEAAMAADRDAIAALTEQVKSARADDAARHTARLDFWAKIVGALTAGGGVLYVIVDRLLSK